MKILPYIFLIVGLGNGIYALVSIIETTEPHRWLNYLPFCLLALGCFIGAFAIAYTNNHLPEGEIFWHQSNRVTVHTCVLPCLS